MIISTRQQQRADATLRDPRWQAVVARDAMAEGTFFYSVTTTGVYCRPSCPARTARPEHVAFHATAADAERAGFRPCKRCRPDQIAPAAKQAALVAELCRYIERAPTVPTLSALAERCGMSAFHLHRVFKSVAGVTPKAYAASCRAERIRTELGRSDTITAAIYDAGYNSNSRFYAQAGALLGMTPTRYRAGGAQTDIRFATSRSSLGVVLAARSERGICAIMLGDDHDAMASDLRERFPRARLIADEADLQDTLARVVAFIEEPRRGLDLPLDIRGTAFQQRVWQALCNIPAGATASYSDIARAIGAPTAVRAVAHACAANALALAIPCHRAVRSDGKLAGYRWGVARKKTLLAREAKR